MMKKLLAAAALLAASSAYSAGLAVNVEIPALDVAEYHKPYVALWIENEQQQTVAQLAVLYDMKMKNQQGEDWLKDMRQWWRKGGRALTMPVDGVSGATKGPGQYDFIFTQGQSPLNTLPAGQYTLRVEAAREVGGRELLNLPFTWPAPEQQSITADGKSELGRVVLTLNP